MQDAVNLYSAPFFYSDYFLICDKEIRKDGLELETRHLFQTVITGFDGIYFLFTPGKFSSGFDTKKKQGK
jgi:hypothetical protein